MKAKLIIDGKMLPEDFKSFGEAEDFAIKLIGKPYKVVKVG